MNKYIIESPAGMLTIKDNGNAVTRLGFGGTPDAGTAPSPLARELEKQLRAYFEGRLKEFDMPLDPGYAPPFTLAVWRELQKIPYGETCTYGEVAAALGKPGAARAVGQACHKNRIAIVIPCHRVLSAGGIGGFGGGVGVKKTLLGIEAGNMYKAV